MRKVVGKTWGADWKRASQEGRFPQGVLSPGWRKGTGAGPWCYSDTDHRVAVETGPRLCPGAVQGSAIATPYPGSHLLPNPREKRRRDSGGALTAPQGSAVTWDTCLTQTLPRICKRTFVYW